MGAPTDNSIFSSLRGKLGDVIMVLGTSGTKDEVMVSKLDVCLPIEALWFDISPLLFADDPYYSHVRSFVALPPYLNLMVLVSSNLDDHVSLDWVLGDSFLPMMSSFHLVTLYYHLVIPCFFLTQGSYKIGVVLSWRSFIGD